MSGCSCKSTAAAGRRLLIINTTPRSVRRRRHVADLADNWHVPADRRNRKPLQRARGVSAARAGAPVAYTRAAYRKNVWETCSNAYKTSA